MASETERVLQGLAEQWQSQERTLAALHYVIYRKTGGFGPKVAATLAASITLQKELEYHVEAKDPKHIEAAVLSHRRLVNFLMTEAEEKLSVFEALFRDGVS